MDQAGNEVGSGNIAVTIIPQANGRCVCEVAPSLGGQTGPSARYHGQNPKHAIAIALENLARKFRMESEAEQKVDWLAVDCCPLGDAIEKRFHVILHYERLIEEESKINAHLHTCLGNTVINFAEMSIIQVDPDLEIEPLSKLHKKP